MTLSRLAQTFVLAATLSACGLGPSSNQSQLGAAAASDKCAGVVCSALDACHVAGVCNPQSGQCSNPTAPDGTTCSDGNACTQADTCHAGRCTAGTPVVCTASDSCHVAGTCAPATGCSNPPAPNGTACSDGNACTQSDSCQAGVCTGSNPVVCTASDQCHAAGSCDPSSGVCSNPAVADGTTCNDGNACTQSDSCISGACTGSDPVVCTAADQCHVAGLCDPTSGVCTNPESPAGTPCSDGNACTLADTCIAGSCFGGAPVTCLATDQCHAAGSCDPTSGACSNPALPDGTTCNDGSLCTQTDACVSGACTGSNPVVCTALDQCHTAGSCDPASGTCSNPAAPDGTSCGDGNACTRSDSCVSGACTGSDPVTCPPPDQCHVAGLCDPTSGECSYVAVADGTACDDGDGCTQSDACTAGKCVGSDPVVCTASDTCHLPGTCDAATGVCSNPPVPQTGPSVTRTQGFFKTHEAPLTACLASGPIALGSTQVTTLNEALGILWASPFTHANQTLRSAHDRALLLLAREVLVATCNDRLFGSTPPSGLLTAAASALTTDDCAQLSSLQAQLASFADEADEAALPSTVTAGPATALDAQTRGRDLTLPTGRSCTP